MEHQKELFIQFMENNMPPEPFDPDKVLAAARETVPDYSRPNNLQKAWTSCCKSPSGGRGRILSRDSSPEEGCLRLPLRCLLLFALCS